MVKLNHARPFGSIGIEFDHEDASAEAAPSDADTITLDVMEPSPGDSGIIVYPQGLVTEQAFRIEVEMRGSGTTGGVEFIDHCAEAARDGRG